MQTWFEVKVKYVKVDQDGRERKVSEQFLIDAVSFTDAEARTIAEMQKIIRGEFQIDSIKKSNIIEIFPAEDGEFWFKARIAIVTIDEKAGKERKVNNHFLVAADDMKEAYKRMEEGLSYVLVPYHSISISLSPIVDVFPYFNSVDTASQSSDKTATIVIDTVSGEITDVEFEEEKFLPE